jgi:1-acyl-sn-glycerol-3-phosphate acyltransferase
VLTRALSYGWRVAATGFAFVILGFGGLVLALTVFPLIAVGSRDGLVRERRGKAIIRSSFQVYVFMLRLLGIIRLEVIGRQQLGECHGALIVANHPTLLDVVLLMSLVPNAQCVVKHQLWRNWFLGPIVRAAGYIRNDLEPNAFIDCCRQTLSAGNNLIIFPEGTRSVPGQPARVRRGFANIALLVPANLQIVHISCDPITLSKGSAWYDIPERRASFRVMIDGVVATGDFIRCGSRALGARRLATYLETRFALRHQ